MLKKIFLSLRFIIIFSIWSSILFVSARSVFLYFWKFDILLVSYWRILPQFWKSGGIIKEWKDYLFVLSILICPILWIYVLTKLVKLKYIQLIYIPINFITNLQVKLYYKKQNRIILKNLSHKDNVGFEEMVETRIEKMQKAEKEKNKNKDLEADKIRKEIKGKMSKKS